MDKLTHEMQKLDKRIQDREAKMNNAFPLHVLPQPLQNIILALVAYYGFPLDYIASTMLHAAATAIGNSRNLVQQWKEAAVLFMVIIGNPGANKSNAIKWAYAPLLKKEKLSHQRSAKQKEGAEGNAPPPEKIITTDSTLEALLEQHDYNRRGLCLWVDEVIRLFSSVKKVNYLLSFFSRMPISNDRKTQKVNIRIDEPFINVIGSIQSSTIADLLQKSNLFENGMVERWLIVKTANEQRSMWKKEKPDFNLTEEWGRYIDLLLGLREERDAEGNLTDSCLVYFCDEGNDAIIHYRNSESECPHDLDEVSHGRILAKMDVYMLRLCIVLHCLHDACSGQESLIISLDTVNKAIALTEYYKQQAFAFWAMVSQKNPLDHLSELKLNIYQALHNNFSTQQGLTKAKEFGMAERTFKYWIKNDTRLFRRLGHGKFQKRYKFK